MKLVEPKVEVLFAPKYAEAMNLLEVAIRNCYDSLDSICHGSAEKIINHVIKSGHESVLEHLSVTMRITTNRNCYDDKTEILTRSGWKYFKDLSADEEVATLNPKTNLVEFHKIYEKIEYPYSGDMVYINTKNCNLLITPNHRLWAKKVDTRVPHDFDFHEAGTLSNRYVLSKEFNYDMDAVKTPFTISGFTYNYLGRYKTEIKKSVPDIEVDRKLWLTFLAMYLSDGNTTKYSDGNYRITITQTDIPKNKETRTLIIDTITRMGFNARVSSRDICFNSPQIGRFLFSLGKSYEKRFPYNPFDIFTRDTAREFINTYLMFDGSRNCPIYGKIYTTSKSLCDSLSTIAMIAGFSTKVLEINRKEVGTKKMIAGKLCNVNKLMYNIHITDKYNMNPYIDVRNSVSTQTYNGMVYCVNVPNHIIFVRRGGVGVWCANCMSQLTRHRVASFCIQSQRYVNFNKDKYGKDIPFIVPEDLDDVQYLTWRAACQQAEDSYIELIEKYHKSTDTARSVLPNCTATTIVMTANIREWRHILELRCDKHASPDMQKIAKMLLKELYLQYPILFKDLMTKFK